MFRAQLVVSDNFDVQGFDLNADVVVNILDDAILRRVLAGAVVLP